MVPQARLELATHGLADRRSFHLSYWGMVLEAAWLCLQGWPRRLWLEWQVAFRLCQAIESFRRLVNTPHIQEGCIHCTGIDSQPSIPQYGDQILYAHGLHSIRQSCMDSLANGLEQVSVMTKVGSVPRHQKLYVKATVGTIRVLPAQHIGCHVTYCRIPLGRQPVECHSTVHSFLRVYKGLLLLDQLLRHFDYCGFIFSHKTPQLNNQY